MTNEQKKNFTMRISQSNRTELLVVLYDVCDCYLGEVETAKDYEEMKDAVHHAETILRYFRNTLDFQYEIAHLLDNLYEFMLRSLSMCIVKKDTKEIPALRRILHNVSSAYEKLAEKDDSAPLMTHTQQIYEGLTYGRNRMGETATGGNLEKRGFFA